MKTPCCRDGMMGCMPKGCCMPREEAIGEVFIPWFRGGEYWPVMTGGKPLGRKFPAGAGLIGWRGGVEAG